MPHSFVSQPLAGGYDLQEFLENACADLSLNRLDFAVAWVKRAGADDVALSLEAFRSRGGYVRGVIGISLGGTSLQGLVRLRDVCDELFVFHEPGRTFHPKVYVACGDHRARTLVGSNNLTGGGLAHNYEAAVVSDLDQDDAADMTYLDAVKAFIDGLVGEDELCHELTDDFTARLARNRRYPLLDEDGTSRLGQDPVEGAGVRARIAADGEVLFGAAKRPKRPRRRQMRPVRGRGRRRGFTGARTASPAGTDPVVKRWFKPFESTDAQQLGGNSSPSNTMTLVDGGHAIDRNTYFRYVFFGSETWTTTTNRAGQPREVTNIEVQIVADGRPLGTYELEVRHTPGYASGEGNRVTELGWREFGRYLRSNSFVGHQAMLEKLRSGRYRLRFERVVTDLFVF